MFFFPIAVIFKATLGHFAGNFFRTLLGLFTLVSVQAANKQSVWPLKATFIKIFNYAV